MSDDLSGQSAAAPALARSEVDVTSGALRTVLGRGWGLWLDSILLPSVPAGTG